MPTPRTFTTITPRQQVFIATLASERAITAEVLPFTHRTMRQEIELAANGDLTNREASSLIDALTALPRTTNRTEHGGVMAPTPSPQTRAGRMLLAGGIEATVTLPDGQHVTINIRTRRGTGRGYANCGPHDEGARTYIKVLGSRIGWINVSDLGAWTLTLRTRNTAYKDAVIALFDYAAGDAVSPCRVQEASRCGRCHRTLTDPVSIDRGIGPECYGRDTGSRHVANNESVTVGVDMPTADALNTVEPVRASTVQAPTHDDATKRARDLIAEALDAYCSDADTAFAMNIFDRLAAR
jgi:hypothetical protein